MKNFVHLIQQVYAENFSTVMNKIITKKIPVAFLSLQSIDNAVETVKNLRAQGLNITNLFTGEFFSDTNNLEFNVSHLSDAAQVYPRPEYVLTPNGISARVALKILPGTKAVTLDRDNTEEIYETFMTHLDDLREVYESLIDEESKKTFRGYWLGCVSNQIGKLVYSNAAHYLINGFIPERGAIVIDAGVFDGGTSAVFAQMGYKVYGFEMDIMNYERSRKVAEENNFVVENLALGSYKRAAHYDVTGKAIGKLLENGSQTVQVTTIDAYVREKNLPRVDFIKMDVEGAELDVLKGAVTTIARFKPILALSAYHKLDDFWTLMNFVKSIRPDYEFALRQSYDTPEDVPSFLTDERRFRGVYIDRLFAAGMEPDDRDFGECVLFAR